LTPTERFDAAVGLANLLHRDQKRKATGIPYLSHLLAVAALVMEDGGSEDEAIAALLHDAVEDQGTAYPGGRAGLRAAIAGRFGGRVLEIVDACTDDDGYDKTAPATPEEVRRSWRDRKQAYLDHLRASRDAGIRRVSCADKLHNAASILSDYAILRDRLWDRFRTRRADDQIWYYSALAQVFDGGSPLERRLREAVREVVRLGAPAGSATV
jgi:(p)ppGpp synthase/HD superfamily hydrolase